MIKNNVQLFLHIQILVFKYFGLLSPTTTNILYKIYGIFTLCMQYSALLFVVIYLGTEWGDMDAMSQNCYFLFSMTSICIKVSVVFFKDNEYKELLEFMKEKIFTPKTSAQEKILLEQSRKMRNVRIFLIVMGISASTLFLWTPVTSQESRTFPMVMWMPVSAESTVGFALGYTYQITYALSAAALFLSIDSLGFTCIIFGCAQLDIVKDKIRKIRNVPTESASTDRSNRDQLLKNNNKLLNDCIDHYQAVLGFFKRVENLFNSDLFIYFCGTVMMICMIGLRLNTDSPNTFIFYRSLSYLCCIMTPLACYCWSGSELTSRCEELRDELYQCPWYEQDRPFRRTVLIAMECMKRPIVFRAGNYIPLSRPTFVSILRCSYSYFAVLNQVVDDK